MTTPMPSGPELVIDCRNALGETPVWCARTQTLFWIDVVSPGRVFHCDSRGAVDFYQFEDLVTGLALRKPAGLLVVGTRDVYEFDPTDCSRRTIFALPPAATDQRFNDGACDRAGRLWIGSMQNNLSEAVRARGRLEPCGGIYCISRDGSSRYFAAQLGCPNAICWSPDERTFYVADSVNGWIYVYDFDLDKGNIDGRREFCRFADLGVPDGAAVDCDGCIWNARWGAGLVARITPQGALDKIVKVPATNLTACCFGGDHMKTLYVTSARFGLSPEQLAAEPYAGGVFALHTEVAGLEKAMFAS